MLRRARVGVALLGVCSYAARITLPEVVEYARDLAEQGRQAAIRATQLLDDDVTRARLLLAGASRVLDPREPTTRSDSLILALFRDASGVFSNIWLSDIDGNVRGSLVPLSQFRRAASPCAERVDRHRGGESLPAREQGEGAQAAAACAVPGASRAGGR